MKDDNTPIIVGFVAIAQIIIDLLKNTGITKTCINAIVGAIVAYLTTLLLKKIHKKIIEWRGKK